MSRKWSQDELEFLKELVSKDINSSNLYIWQSFCFDGDFHRSIEAVSKMVAHFRKELRNTKTPENILYIKLPDPEMPDMSDISAKQESTFMNKFYTLQKNLCDAEIIFDEVVKENLELFRMSNKHYGKIGNPDPPFTKTVAISDLHIPFINSDLIYEVLELHGDATNIVINGDIFDQYEVSTFPKSKFIPLTYEYKVAFKLVKMFADTFKNVYLISGNHDRRVARLFGKTIDPCLSFLTHPDPLERIACGYDIEINGLTPYLKKVCDFNNVHYASGPCNWYTKIGKVMYVHPDSFSKPPLKTAVDKCDHFMDKNIDFDCLVMSHTHHIGSYIYRGKLLIEQGCCCLPMSLEANAKRGYSAQHFGYAVIHTANNGRVDFETSRPVFYGIGSFIKENDIDE